MAKKVKKKSKKKVRTTAERSPAAKKSWARRRALAQNISMTAQPAAPLPKASFNHISEYSQRFKAGAEFAGGKSSLRYGDAEAVDQIMFNLAAIIANAGDVSGDYWGMIGRIAEDRLTNG